jgi:hypothetical protein
MLTEEVLRRLSIALPSSAAIETVSEAGTSTLREEGFRRKLRDSDSAMKIATKKGTSMLERKPYDSES